MKKLLVALTSIALVLGLVACGGGGGGNSSTGGTYFTHAELAAEFVRRVNVDVSGYDIQLVKTNTLQTDYIVVYDWVYGTYDAYYLGAYNPGENLYNYLVAYDYAFYYDLDQEGGNTYRDWFSGILFEKVEAGTKNLAKMKAFQQDFAINKAAQGLVADYGMSVEKAYDAARFAYNLKTLPAGTYSKADYDSFAQELTGSTITEFQNDIASGNLSSLQERLAKAGQVSGAGAEGVAKLIADIGAN